MSRSPYLSSCWSAARPSSTTSMRKPGITAARNQCRDLHRKWRRNRVVRLDQHPVVGKPADAREDGDLEDKLLRLPPSHRLILYLYYYEGYKLAEIGNMLHLNLNTVKTRMRTAKKRLKLEMGDEEK